MTDRIPDLFIVRLWDGMDRHWVDVSKALPMKEIQAIYDEKTENGTKNISYDDLDYFKIFPADTKMLYGDGNSMIPGRFASEQ